MRLLIVGIALLVTLSGVALGAPQVDYDQLVAEAQADLSLGRTSQALAESKAAIALAPRHWQAYVVAAGALQMEGRYHQAIDNFKQALAHAPDTKKAAVKSLLEKCRRQQIATTSTPPSKSPSTPERSNPPGKGPNEGPSYRDTVAWITNHMALAGLPQDETTSTDQFASYRKSESFSITFQSCDGITVRRHFSTIETPVGVGAGGPHTSDLFDAVFQFDIRHVAFYLHSSSPEGLDVAALDGAGNWHFHSDSGDGSSPIDWSSELSFDALKGKMKNFYHGGGQAYAGEAGAVNLGTLIPIGEIPGSEGLAPHMVKALQHLIDLCKNHPEEAPRSLF